MGAVIRRDVRHLTKHFGVALTGSIATGKTVIANILRDAGHLVLDADQLAREAVSPGSRALSELSKKFGQGIVLPDGALDRSQLRSLMLNSPDAKTNIEAILHPVIEDLLTQALIQADLVENPKLFFYEAALIFERQRGDDFLEVWSSWCPKAAQLERLIKRSEGSLTSDEALQLISTQWSPDEKAAKAHRRFDTDVPLAVLRTAVLDAVKSLQSRP